MDIIEFLSCFVIALAAACLVLAIFGAIQYIYFIIKRRKAKQYSKDSSKEL